MNIISYIYIAVFLLLQPFAYGNYPKSIKQLSDVDVINVKDFGAKGDGITDDAKAIQSALNYAASSSHSVKRVYLPYAFYAIHSHLSVELGITLFSNEGAILNFEQSADTSAIIILPAKNTLRSFFNTDKLTLYNLHIVGNTQAAYTKPVVKYKKMTALEFNTPGIGIENCLIEGFDKGTLFKTNAYMISFRNSSFYYNNIGVSFDYASYTNLGERVNFDNCAIGNNNYGIYNNKGYSFFINCSIDYNNFQQIKDNITESGGVTGAALILNNCHIEREGMDTIGKKIINHGYLRITNCILDYSGEGPGPLIENSGNLYIDGNVLRGDNNGYLVSGKPPVSCHDNQFIDDYRIQLIHPDLNLLNGSFETGTQGWHTTNSTVMSLVSNKSHSGSKSVKLQSWQYGTGAMQDTIKVTPGTQLSVVFWINFMDDASGTNYANLYFYNSSNTKIASSFQQTISTPGKDVFVRNTIPWKIVPPNAAYAVIEFQTTGRGGKYSALFDDIYVTMQSMN